MSFNGKHLSLEDRKIIEENINKGLRKFETAKNLIKVNQQQEKKQKTIENVDIHKWKTYQGNANITMNVKSALECVLISKKFHV